jgi:uncharacterized protein (UPF0333 family)
MQPNKTIRDQRGVAMIFELVLVAAVLALVGLAVYQASNRSKTSSTATKPAPVTATSLATSAAASAIQDSAADASISASAEAATDEVSSTDSDVSNLGGSSENAF